MGDTVARRFLVWGGGGHGKVLADLVRVIGGSIVGYVDSDPAKLNASVEPGGARVIASEEQLLVSLDRGWLPGGADALALAIGRNEVRHACFRRAAGISVPPLVHPSAVVSASARVGGGSVIFAGAIVNAQASLGDAVIVNSSAIVEHDCIIGNGVHVSPGAVLAGGVKVADRSWIGIGATVIPGVRIGRDVVVGAGAVVLNDVADGMTVAGVPARNLHANNRS